MEVGVGYSEAPAYQAFPLENNAVGIIVFIAFLEYVDACGIVNGESVVDSFVIGFGLGARFTYDVFVLPENRLLKED